MAKGDNLTEEDRKRGGENSHTDEYGSKGGSQTSGQSRGNFGNAEEHKKAGSMSSGHTDDPEEHSEAGKMGGQS